MGGPEGIRSPHASDDDLEPAVTFLKKYRFFLEDMWDFSDRVARCYYARELSQHTIDSLAPHGHQRAELPSATFSGVH